MCSNPRVRILRPPAQRISSQPSPVLRMRTRRPEGQSVSPTLSSAQRADPRNGDVGEFTFAGQQVVNENFITTRVDHKFSDKDAVFGTYVFDRTPYSAPDSMNNVMLGSLSSRQIAAVEENS